MKPGYKTTEFLALVLLNAANVAASLESALSPKWAAIAGAVSVGLYAIGRGLAKGAAATSPGAEPSSTGSPTMGARS